MKKIPKAYLQKVFGDNNKKNTGRGGDGKINTSLLI